MNRLQSIVGACLLGLSALAVGQTPAPPVLPAGTFLEVLLRHEGTPPARQPLRLTPEQTRFSEEAARFCGRCAEEGRLWDETYVVGPEGGIRDVAVMLPKVAGPAAAVAEVRLDNRACRFEPRIQFVPVGVPVMISNSDPLMHNARIGPSTGPTVWNGLIAPDAVVKGPTLLRSGTFTVTCDAHPWMQAWLLASRAAHRGVTGDSGSLRFGPLEVAGPVTVVAWHPELGRAQVDAPLTAGQTSRISLSQKDFRK